MTKTLKSIFKSEWFDVFLFFAQVAAVGFIRVKETNIISVSFIIVFIALLMTAKAFFNKRKFNELNSIVKGYGLMFDKTSGIKNIMLRIKTVDAMLGRLIIKNENLYELGSSIGKNFYDEYDKYATKSIKGWDAMTIREKITKIFEYDSTSGMGNFRLIQIIGDEAAGKVRIELQNIFSCGDGQYDDNRCDFIKGYLSGIIDGIRKTDIPKENFSIKDCGGKLGYARCEIDIQLF